MADKNINGSILVHVWDSRWWKGSPGHAAIHIGNHYISFWPGESNGVLSWSGYKMKSYEEDLKTYRDAKQDHWCKYIPHDDNGAHGLNKVAMLKRWESIKKQKPDYTSKTQCSGIVNQLLLAGGSQKYAPTKLTSWSSWYLYAVSPSDVRDYVEILVPAIRKKK